jgi:hypothetical protein
VLTAAVEAAQEGLVEAALVQLGDWRAILRDAALGAAGNSVRELVAT